jgi:hypothetical protein
VGLVLGMAVRVGPGLGGWLAAGAQFADPTFGVGVSVGVRLGGWLAAGAELADPTPDGARRSCPAPQAVHAGTSSSGASAYRTIATVFTPHKGHRRRGVAARTGWNLKLPKASAARLTFLRQEVGYANL